MPLRSVKMNRFILGFQRRVWCPKWVPLSSSCFMVTTAIVGHIPLLSVVARHPLRPGPGACGMPHPSPGNPETGPHGNRLVAGARSQPASELRPGVYTDSAGGFSTGLMHLIGAGVAAALNWPSAVGGADPGREPGQRGAGGCRRRPARLAVASAAGY